MKKALLFLSLCCLVLSCTAPRRDYFVCAYVWPSCHDDSLAHKWLWPDGEGEWEVFRNYLQVAKEYADARRDSQPPFVMINAWNEWVEGSYLLPDKLNGYGYLEAVRDVFGK